MQHLTNEQKDALAESYEDMAWNKLENPCELIVRDLCKRLGVFIWGDYIANSEILNLANEPSLSPRDIARMEQAENEWIREAITDWAEDLVDKGEKPNFEAPVSKSFDDHNNAVPKLYSSQIFPVDDDTINLLNTILTTFNAFVMAGDVLNAKEFKKHFELAWQYQCNQMEDWEDQWLPEEDLDLTKYFPKV